MQCALMKVVPFTEGLMYPLNSKPLPNSIPANWNLNEKCEYHQTIGQATYDCKAIRHAIQDLIKARKILDPSLPNYE